MSLPELKTSLAARLRSLRLAAKLSLNALARNSGMSATHVSQIERARARPSLKTLHRLADALGVTLEAVLDGVPFKPRHGGKRVLKKMRPFLRDAFRVPRQRVPPRTLRAAFKLASFTNHGPALLGQLDAQRHRKPYFWKALKEMIDGLNGPEQLAVLHALVPNGELEEVHPAFLGFVRPILDDRAGRWLGVVVPIDNGYVVLFPQVGIAVEKGRYLTPDFLICVAIDGKRRYGALELDGEEHGWRVREDAARDRILGMPVVRVSVEQVDRADFMKRLIKAVVQEPA